VAAFKVVKGRARTEMDNPGDSQRGKQVVIYDHTAVPARDVARRVEKYLARRNVRAAEAPRTNEKLGKYTSLRDERNAR
jgi:hypothetical protein